MHERRKITIFAEHGKSLSACHRLLCNQLTIYQLMSHYDCLKIRLLYLLAGVAIYLAYGIRHSREHEAQRDVMSEEQRILIPVGSDALFTDAVDETGTARPAKTKPARVVTPNNSMATPLRV
jgi:hypothetical protein